MAFAKPNLTQKYIYILDPFLWDYYLFQKNPKLILSTTVPVDGLPTRK